MSRPNEANVKFTQVQAKRQWEERLAVESHHESSLPSQRYQARNNSLLKSINPIVPEELTEEENTLLHEFPPPGRTFDELNAPPQRSHVLGNPIFGYSTHPPPPPIPKHGSTRHSATSPSQTSGGSSASRARMLQLQQELAEERRLRKELEAQLGR